MASGHVLLLEWDHVRPQKALAALAGLHTGKVWVCFQRCRSRKQLWLKGCYVLREALGMFDCWIFEIRLLYSRCLHPAQPQGTDLCRYLGIQAGAELDLCPNTASSSSAARQGKSSPNHFLLTAQCGSLGLKMHNWVKA